MSDSFFDMPAGYSDADLEMASLERRGNEYARLAKKAGGAYNVERLREGEIVYVQRFVRGAEGEDCGKYTAAMRMTDPDIDGGLEFSIDDGSTWHATAKAARLAAQAG